MKYSILAYRDEQMRIEDCADRLAIHLDWKLVPVPELLPPSLRAHLWRYVTFPAGAPTTRLSYSNIMMTGLVMQRRTAVYGQGGTSIFLTALSE
ncbi:hypothetical protein HNQ87_002858 [Pacificimonas flava]|nr:hypothetical protein [Pacificimonas flava]